MSRWISVLCFTVVLSACSERDIVSMQVPGDARAGRAAIERFDCGVCHTIPGVRGARGLVAPPLELYRRRVYIAGKFPNTPEMLARWIQDPPALVPATAMPALGVSDLEARDIAAYLFEAR